MSVTGEAGGEPSNAACRWRTSRPGCTAPSPSPRRCARRPAPGRAHRRAHAGRHAGHRRAADLRVLRQRARSGQARLRPSAQRAYQTFRCKGGYFGMAAGNQALWKSVCEVVGRDDLLADARFADTSLRARRTRCARSWKPSSPATRPRLAARFRGRIPCAPINTYSEVLADPQVEHMGWVQPLELQRRAHAHLRPAGALRRTDHGAASPPASAGRAQRGSAGRAARGAKPA